MASGRFKLHQLAGKEFSADENLALVQQAKRIIDDELQGDRDVTITPDNRLLVSPRTNPVEENISQQILTLLINSKAETDELKGQLNKPNIKYNDTDNQNIKILHELIGRGLLHPDSLQVAGRGFRNPSSVSTDDLVEKFITTIYQKGRGYDSETGAAFNKQYTQAGHKLDDNLYPELSHDINNIALQARIANLVTADSAKDRSGINPKYKSIIDQRNKALELTQSQYANGFTDTKYTDDGDFDIYGSAVDNLIEEVRSDLNENSLNNLLEKVQGNPKRKAGEAIRTLVGGSGRTDSPGANRERALVIDSGGGDVTIGEGVLRSNGKNGNGNGKH